jgi:hypothetical protein
MVLPVRIELTTSALPRMRSTTELRQHFRLSRKRRKRRAGLHCQGYTDVNETKDAREERLAAALRENLRRRKARARGEAQAVPASAPFESDEAQGIATLPDTDGAGD